MASSYKIIMPEKKAASRCIFPDCGLVFTGEIQYEGTNTDTVFDPNSSLIRRAATHHLYRNAHSLFALFATKQEAKNAKITEPSILAATNPLQAYYDKFPNMLGHVVVTKNRNVIGGKIES